MKIMEKQRFTDISGLSYLADRTFFITVITKYMIAGINNTMLFLFRQRIKFLVDKITSINRIG